MEQRRDTSLVRFVVLAAVALFALATALLALVITLSESRDVSLADLTAVQAQLEEIDREAAEAEVAAGTATDDAAAFRRRLEALRQRLLGFARRQRAAGTNLTAIEARIAEVERRLRTVAGQPAAGSRERRRGGKRSGETRRVQGARDDRR